VVVGDPPMTIELPPVGLALISAFLFALGVQFQSIGLSDVNARRGTAISIATSAVLYWLVAPWFLVTSNWFQPAVLIFALVGFFRPTLSANLAVAGTRYLGPTLSTTLSSTSPLFGAAMGVLWLGEILTWQIAAGTCGIIMAVLLLSSGNLRLNSNWPVWALALPIGAAAIRSMAHILSKIGMEDIPDPYFVGLVGFTVSAIITSVALRIKPMGPSLSWRSKGPYWFVLSGLTMGVAIMSLNTALLNGQVTTVIPIVASSPIFSMLLSIFIFKREHLSARIALAVLMVVASVIFIALNR
jgi:drug/metabolite transporter, DME family